jgi:selenocysteine lyase/cysteine desulfurase
MSLCASMRSYRLPIRRAATREDARGLVAALWQGERIQSMAVEFGGELLLRISAQAYVGEEDVAALAAALARGGWPGR